MRHYIGSMRPVLTALLVLFIAISESQAAAEPYGKRYVAADDADFVFAAPAEGEIDDTRLRELREQAAFLEQRVQTLEYEEGPYGTGLAEPLGDLARLLDEAGEPERAMAVRERALHLVRVNEGLGSPAQGPLVRDMLEGLIQSGDMEALDARYEYFFRLYGAGRPPWNELRWSATLEYLRWQRQVLVLGMDGDLKPRLLELNERHEDILEILQEPGTVPDWRRLRDISLSQLQTYYLVEDLIQPAGELSQQYGEYRAPEDPMDFDLRRERLENLQRSLRRRGRSLLENLLIAIPESEERERAAIQLTLADWLQWYGAAREARSRYEALWSSLHAQGHQDLAERWFSVPTPLPAGGAFFVDSRPSSGILRVSLEVTAYGRARAGLLSDSSSRETSRLRRALSATRFRPRISNGAAQDWIMQSSAWRLLDP